MLSRRAAEYVLHQHLSSGTPLEDVVAKWTRTYPDDPVIVVEAEAYIKEYLRLYNDGVGAFAASQQVFDNRGRKEGY